MENKNDQPPMENVLGLSEFLDRCSKVPVGFTEDLPLDMHSRQLIMDTVLVDWYYPGPREHKLYREVDRIMRLAKTRKSSPSIEKLALANTKEWLKNYKNKKWEPIPLYKKPVRTLSLFGSPGMGKTQFWDHVMANCYEQVLLHNNRLEVSYLVINCSAFKSMKALCQSIFREFDQALINYYDAHDLEYKNPYLLEFDKGNYTAEKMLPYIANIAHHHRLNVLILDEINHITDGNKEFESIVNFFKNLSRAIGLPIIFSGTQDSLEKLSVNLQAIRRLGVITEWAFYKDGTKTWNRFIEGLWDFQITPSRTLLTEEIKSAYHEKSGGMIDAAIQIHVKCQTEAVEYNKVVDNAFVNKIADKYFPGFKKAIRGVHSKDPYILKRYKDIQVGFPTLLNSITDNIDFGQITKKIAGMDLTNGQVSVLLEVLRTQYPNLTIDSAKEVIEKTVAQAGGSQQEEKAENLIVDKKAPTSSKITSKGVIPSLESSDVNDIEKKLREMGLSEDL